MFKDLFCNRLFIGALAFFVLCVGGSLLYQQHVERQTAREFAEAQEHIKGLTEKPKPTAEVPEGDTLQKRHFHADGTWHEGPHEAETPVARAADPVWEEYPYGPPDSPLSPEERVEQAWYNREFKEIGGEKFPTTPMPVLYRHYFNSDEEHYKATKRWHELGVAQNKLIHEVNDRLEAEHARIVEAARRERMGGKR